MLRSYLNIIVKVMVVEKSLVDATKAKDQVQSIPDLSRHNKDGRNGTNSKESLVPSNVEKPPCVAFAGGNT